MKEQLSSLVPFNRHVGVEITDVAMGRGAARLVESPAIVNHVGTMHAGALFTLAEAASGAAIVGTFADVLLRVSLVVRDTSMTFLRPARGTITAIATTIEDRPTIEQRIDGNGRAETSVFVSLADTAGVEVARMQVSWHLKRR